MFITYKMWLLTTSWVVKKIQVKSYTYKGLKLTHVLEHLTQSWLSVYCDSIFLYPILCLSPSLSLSLHLPLFLFLLSLVSRKNLRCTRIKDNQGKEKITKTKGQLVRNAFSKPLFLHQKWVINLPLNFLLTKEESLISCKSSLKSLKYKTHQLVCKTTGVLCTEFCVSIFSGALTTGMWCDVVANVFLQRYH